MRTVELTGRRVLLTQSEDFMGSALARVMAELGAELVSDPRVPGESPELAARIGQVFPVAGGWGA